MTAMPEPKKSGVSELLILRREFFFPFLPSLYLSFLLSFPPHPEVWVTVGCTFINNETQRHLSQLLSWFLVWNLASQRLVVCFWRVHAHVYTAWDLHTKNPPFAHAVANLHSCTLLNPSPEAIAALLSPWSNEMMPDMLAGSPVFN